MHRCLLAMPCLWICLLLPASANAIEPLAMQALGNGIYVHHGAVEDLSEGYHGDICNIGFIVGSKGVAVIDTGGSLKIGQQLRMAIKKITALPILYVINTHVHPDHIFGNAAFLADKPQFTGHAKLAEAMERRKESYMRMSQNWLGADFAGSEIIKPTLAVEHTQQLDLGGRVLTLTAYPVAHTNTDLTVFDHNTATLWTGDLLFVERTPSIDGDIKGWLAVIAQLKVLPAKQIVPGHGPVVSQAASAYSKEEQYLSILLNDVRTNIKKGIVMEKTMDTAAASEQDKWLLFNTINRRNVNTIYPVLEWE